MQTPLNSFGMLSILAQNVLIRKGSLPSDLVQYFEPAECGKCYVCSLVEVFREVRRVLRDDGTCWLNLGDSFGHGTSAKRNPSATSTMISADRHTAQGGRHGGEAKQLLGIPWRAAFALQADGWWLRSDIIWSKPNCMPESVTDRPTKAHEYVFLLTKSANYWYDAEAIRDESVPSSQARARYNGKQTAQPKATQGVEDGIYCGVPSMAKAYGQGRNKRSVWTIPTQPYSGAHFAVMPEALVEPCILAGCPETVCAVCGAPYTRVVETHNPSKQAADYENIRGFVEGRTANPQSSKSLHRNKGGVYSTAVSLGFTPSCTCGGNTAHGVVIDPFMGSGTTARTALRLNRDYIGIDLNPDYVAMARDSVRMPLAPLETKSDPVDWSNLPLFRDSHRDENGDDNRDG